jgi:hypothetical protein
MELNYLIACSKLIQKQKFKVNLKLRQLIIIHNSRTVVKFKLMNKKKMHNRVANKKILRS